MQKEVDDLTIKISNLEAKVASISMFPFKSKKEFTESITLTIAQSLKEEEKLHSLNNIKLGVWLFGILNTILIILAITTLYWLAT